MYAGDEFYDDDAPSGPDLLPCCRSGPRRPPLGFRFLCTEPDGHEGDHVARGNEPDEGEYDRWPREAPESVDA